MDTRGSITQFGPVKLVKKATSPTGSITQDANPEGVNQYSGGGSGKAERTANANAQSASAKQLSEKAKAASERAYKGDKESRGYGTANAGRHSDAAAIHSQAVSSHEKASSMHYNNGNKAGAVREQSEANQHRIAAANHESRMTR